MHHIIIQKTTKRTFAPYAAQLRHWAITALNNRVAATEVTIRLVDKIEMTRLNATYRGQHRATNVLSFPLHLATEVTLHRPVLGDIAICAAIVNEEAMVQNKKPEAHWAHIVVHGIFHLLGYDHETEHDANIMEALERETLKALGFDHLSLGGPCDPHQTP
jgi:probable rRNA maturation factor